MKRLKIFIILFCLAVSLPLAYVAWQTYSGLAQEEQAQLSYFAEALLDEMENALAAMIQKEESRSVEEYHHTLARDGAPARPSPLARLPEQHYIIGYFQNNPDGSFQTPLVADLQDVPDDRRDLVTQLAEINRVFNRKKFSIPSSSSAYAPKLEESVPQESEPGTKKKKSETGLAERYLSPSPQKTSKAYLGRKEIRTEELTARQALNLATPNSAPDNYKSDRQRQGAAESTVMSEAEVKSGDSPSENEPRDRDGFTQGVYTDNAPAGALDEELLADSVPAERFQVEVAPFQSVYIDAQKVFIFRRIAIGNQIYRQGFVVHVPALLNDLAENQFRNQPLSDFMELRMQVMDHGRNQNVVRVGPASNTPRFTTQRRFPPPFDFLRAALQADVIPSSPARGPLNTALVILSAVMLLGLLAIYQSARTVVDMSERRSQFVSSVTHELKTPLTNIRMYIEMLEQGIAATPEREQEYLHVLDAESARLARLINNVLELAKLEKKQRRFQYEGGDLQDVFSEVSLIMSQKLKQEGFTLSIEAGDVPVFCYDREVLVQLMVNLMENSIKFGRQSDRRHITLAAGPDSDHHIRIAISDTGPGIPRQALKKVFNDFYRVDNDLTRTTGGTGIGLALVKKFVVAMGGRVHAVNNSGPGCTITLHLPRRPLQS